MPSRTLRRHSLARIGNVLTQQTRHKQLWLLDCDYKTPQDYMSAVAARLRELNACERHNPHATAMMTQAFERVKKCVFEAGPLKACPPDLTRVPNLNDREKKIFSMWQQSGLRPQSMVFIRDDMVEKNPESLFVKIKVRRTPSEFVYEILGMKPHDLPRSIRCRRSRSMPAPASGS